MRLRLVGGTGAYQVYRAKELQGLGFRATGKTPHRESRLHTVQESQTSNITSRGEPTSRFRRARRPGTRKSLGEDGLDSTSDPMTYCAATAEVLHQPSWFPVLLKRRESHQNRPASIAGGRGYFLGFQPTASLLKPFGLRVESFRIREFGVSRSGLSKPDITTAASLVHPRPPNR